MLPRWYLTAAAFLVCFAAGFVLSLLFGLDRDLTIRAGIATSAFVAIYVWINLARLSRH